MPKIDANIKQNIFAVCKENNIDLSTLGLIQKVGKDNINPF
jgi:hypothetical protein